MYIWRECTVKVGGDYKVSEMSVDGVRLGHLYQCKGRGYFAYFLGFQLNSKPIIASAEAKELVQTAHARWLVSRGEYP